MLALAGSAGNKQGRKHMSELQNLEEMIQAFKDVHLEKLQTEPEQTFMQLSGYPHFENVCSNLLSFFFDTEEMHGFADLFLKSLLACIGKDNDSYTTENVERESVTNERKRIDIVIETENHLIAIENKIFSVVQNPLGDYEKYIEEQTRLNGKTTIAYCSLFARKKKS